MNKIPMLEPDYVGKGFRWFIFYTLGVLLVLTALWAAEQVNAATASDDTVTLQLRRGTAYVTLMPAPTTLAECEQRKAGLIAIDADTRFSGTATYSCVETRRSVVTFSANPPPPVPVDCAVSAWTDWVLGTPNACVSGQQTRQDSRSRTIVTEPTDGGAVCPSLSETRVEALACAVTPPPPGPLTAPTLATPTHEAHSTTVGRYNVTLTWSAVPGATSYRVNRCVGPPCSTMSVIQANVSGTPTTAVCQGTCQYKNTNIPANTYKFQVYARRGTTEIGPASNLQVYVVTATVTPPPPPPPPGTGTARLNWSWEGKPPLDTKGNPVTIAGYRFLYSTVGDAGPSLSQTLNLGPVLTHEFTGLASGRWAFGIMAIDAQGLTSQLSNLVYRDVP